MRASGWETRALAALLVVHIVLGIYYAVTIPIFESYDEIGHYRFVRYVADERRLPDPTKPLIAENDETHQPPLYYLLAAIPLTLADLGEDTSPKLNPHMWSGPVQGGANRVVHDPLAERWPYRGTTLAVRLARLASVLIAAFGLLFTYAAARTAFPDDPWVRWGATWLAAFWPQYRFLSAVITNDIMVTVCGAAVTWLLLKVVARDRPSLPDMAALGLATALALLAKNNALGLLPPVLVVVGLTFLRSQSAHRKRLLLSLVGAAAVSAVAIGWWYARNINSGVGALGRYRSFSILLATVRRGFLADPSRWRTLLPAFATALPTLWASFGWGNISLPEWVSWSALGWSTLAMLALFAWLVRRQARGQTWRVWVLLLVIVSVSAISVTHIVSLGARIVPGRYLLPALPALCILLAKGWSEVFRGRGRLITWAASGSTLLVLAVLIPALCIAPAYSLPPRLPEAQLAEYTPIHCTFGSFVELGGYRIQDPFVASSGEVRVSLAWRVLGRADADYSLAVQVFEGQRELIGEVHRFPGHGALATSTWEPGYTFREDLVIPVESHIAGGHIAWIEVSFYEHQTLAPVPVFDANGTNIGASVRMAQVKVRATPRTDTRTKQSALLFGPAIGLIGSRVQACLASPTPYVGVELEWLAIQSPGTDYKVSIQLRDAEQTIVSQVDELPRQGTNPTRFWEPGETVADHHTLPLPALLPSGTYTMYVCLYDSVSLQRLPVTDARGEALPLAEVPLLTLTQEMGKEAQVLPIRSGDHTPSLDSSCERGTTATTSD
jgi:hypothetical protein